MIPVVALKRRLGMAKMEGGVEILLDIDRFLSGEEIADPKRTA